MRLIPLRRARPDSGEGRPITVAFDGRLIRNQ